MAQSVLNTAEALERNPLSVPAGTDLVEWYFEQGWTDGLPVVPPTRRAVDAFVEALGGDPQFVECKMPPRHGSLTREVLAINMVMAGCKPEYAPVVRAAMLALTAKAFNLNGVQATTHMAAPLLVVNGPIAREIGMNGDCNAFGPGNRANATIGRALRLVLLNVGGGRPGDLDKSTLGTRANTLTASPRTRRRARGRRTTSKRASRPTTRRSSCWRQSRRTASPITSQTTRKAFSTASARQ